MYSKGSAWAYCSSLYGGDNVKTSLYYSEKPNAVPQKKQFFETNRLNKIGFKASPNTIAEQDNLYEISVAKAVPWG